MSSAASGRLDSVDSSTTGAASSRSVGSSSDRPRRLPGVEPGLGRLLGRLPSPLDPQRRPPRSARPRPARARGRRRRRRARRWSRRRRPRRRRRTRPGSRRPASLVDGARRGLVDRCRSGHRRRLGPGARSSPASRGQDVVRNSPGAPARPAPLRSDRSGRHRSAAGRRTLRSAPLGRHCSGAPLVGRVVAGGSTHRTALARRRMNAHHTVAASNRSPPRRRARRDAVRTDPPSLSGRGRPGQLTDRAAYDAALACARG